MKGPGKTAQPRPLASPLGRLWLTLNAASRTEKQADSRASSRTSISACSATVQPTPPPALEHSEVRHCEASTWEGTTGCAALQGRCKAETKLQKHETSGQDVGVASCGTWSLGVAVPMILVRSSSMSTRGSSSGPF